jgi:hypothetical protein
MTVAPISATALSAVPANLAGIASGVNNTLSPVGQPAHAALVYCGPISASSEGLSRRTKGLNWGGNALAVPEALGQCDLTPRFGCNLESSEPRRAEARL